MCSEQGQDFAASGFFAAPMDGVRRESIQRSLVAVNSEVVQCIRSVGTPLFQEQELDTRPQPGWARRLPSRMTPLRR